MLARPGWVDFVFAFHDGEEIGPRQATGGEQVDAVDLAVYAYDTKTERLSCLDSNGLEVVKDYLEQSK